MDASELVAAGIRTEALILVHLALSIVSDKRGNILQLSTVGATSNSDRIRRARPLRHFQSKTRSFPVVCPPQIREARAAVISSLKRGEEERRARPHKVAQLQGSCFSIIGTCQGVWESQFAWQRTGNWRERFHAKWKIKLMELHFRVEEI